MYYKILIAQIFFSAALCSQDLRHTDPPSSHQLTNHSTTTESPSNTTVKDKVHLKLYYETLCPASVDFFVAQLDPAVKRLGSHLDVHLIPYGHATTHHSRGKYRFRCQHGFRECHGNMMHACAIDVLQDNARAISFNACLMQLISYYTDKEHLVSAVRWCAFTENVNSSEIWQCMYSPRGALLLKGYGEETQQLQPSYVPYLMLDGSNENEEEARSNLILTVCQMLTPKPVECFNIS